MGFEDDDALVTMLFSEYKSSFALQSYHNLKMVQFLIFYWLTARKIWPNKTRKLPKNDVLEALCIMSKNDPNTRSTLIIPSNWRWIIVLWINLHHMPWNGVGQLMITHLIGVITEWSIMRPDPPCDHPSMRHTQMQNMNRTYAEPYGRSS